ncbi:major capsid protein [Microvirus mar6]|uniref:Major capsid protein n=1 Tax=Microvirus mar6 TaxID=2851196 RepID=A0A8F5MLE4_9VIRU|nr:major capsid protein [Microvirus mar6]
MRLRRYRHNRSNTRLASFNMGRCVPTAARHCIAGTTVVGGIAAGLMLAPMVHQALTKIRSDCWAVAAPDRILWEDAEAFYTGGEDGNIRPEPPYIMSPADGGWPVGSLADHLGFPTGVPNLKCNALPFRLYAYWWNENVRRDHIQEEVPMATTSGLDTVTNTELLNINWPKDMFTTATLEQQLGDEVVIPLATSAPVVAKSGTATLLSIFDSNNGTGHSVNLRRAADGNINSLNYSSASSDFDTNLYSDLSHSSGVLPSDFKFAMAQQAWKSRRNLYGSRFKDWLAFLGIRYSDARLQLPRVIGRGSATMDINAVLQTAPGTGSSVGEAAGRGTGFASCRYKSFFEEPTTVIHVVAVRPAPVYVNIVPPEWDWEVREDLYTPEFAHVGMVLQRKGVLFPTGNEEEDNQPFGYRNRYDEMRTGFNDVSGAFKTTNLSYHQGRVFETAPSLNSDFLECNPSPRIFANMNGDHVEAAAIRNTFIEKNMVSPDGNPRF